MKYKRDEIFRNKLHHKVLFWIVRKPSEELERILHTAFDKFIVFHQGYFLPHTKTLDIQLVENVFVLSLFQWVFKHKFCLD